MSGVFKVILANGDCAYAERTAGAELAATTLVREAKTTGLSDDRIHVLVGESVDAALWTTVLIGVKPYEVEEGLERALVRDSLIRGWV